MTTATDTFSSPSDSGVAPDRRDIPTQVRTTIGTTIQYATRVIEDVVKPSIKTFLETCDTNPQVAAIVAAPALLAFLLVVAFFVISTLILVLWSVITISVGILFVVLGGLLSLFFKLLVVIIATIPLAGVATGLLVGANAISQFIIKKIPAEGMGGLTRAVQEVDWKQLTEGATTAGQHVAQWIRDAMPLLLIVRDDLSAIGSTIGLALHSGLETAVNALHHSPGTENTSLHAQPRESSAKEPVVETPHVPIPALIELDDEITEKIDSVNISNLSTQSESPGRDLKQRIPFANAGDDGAE